jgi:hypothetical protein
MPIRAVSILYPSAYGAEPLGRGLGAEAPLLHQPERLPRPGRVARVIRNQFVARRFSGHARGMMAAAVVHNDEEFNMAQISNTGRRSLARFMAGVMFAATIAVASFAGTASAADHRDWHGDRQWHHGWGGGYY